MIRAGRMRERIDIEQTTANTADGAGGFTPTDSDYATSVPTRHTYGRGVEIVRGDQIEAIQDHTFEIRYDSGVTAQMRVEWESLTMNIHSVIHDERNTMTTITCLQEQV